MKQYDEMMNKLKEKFTECPEIPEGLSRDSIVKAIKEKNIKPEPKKTFSFKAEVIAAVFAVIIVVAVVLAQGGFANIVHDSEIKLQNDAQAENELNPSVLETEDEQMQENAAEILPEGVYSFTDSENVKEHFLSLYREKGSFNVYVYDGMFYDAVTATAAATAAPGGASDMGTAMPDTTVNESVKEHGNTNVQVAGVDEGDIIKNDGKFIYIATGSATYESRLKIVNTQTMEVAYSGKIEVADTENVTVEEIYVNGDILTVVYDRSDYEDYYYERTSHVDVYDISDRSKPKKVNSKSQDGSFVSSRMIGSVIYNISRHYVRGNSEQEVEKYALPMVDGKALDGCCVYHFDDDSTVYTVVTALDTANEKAESKSVAILGDVGEIYCSGKKLYTLSGIFEENQDKTVITSFSLDGTDVTCKAKGTVPGSFNNNYSFDEYNGYLRCATTNYDYTSYKNVSSIYVLNENLEIIGSAINIADDEQVKSVRFMGDKGYVVTFRQTDPLFSLDLSDPKNPKVMGELKLPGYSTYLHPLSDKLLLGIGYGGDEENADTNDLKIALFDISDMTNPKLLDDFIIECAHSEVNYEPKALINYAEKNIIGIPVTSYDYGVYETKTVKSFAILNYTDNEISQVTGFVHDTTGSSKLFRGTYIGEKLYTVDEYKIAEHSLSSGEKLRECPILTEDEKITQEEVSTVVATTAGGFFAEIF